MGSHGLSVVALALGVESSDRFARKNDRKVETVAIYVDEATFKHIQLSGVGFRSRDGTAKRVLGEIVISLSVTAGLLVSY